MFVVKVENDEALMFRVFSKLSAAKAWALLCRNRDGDCVVDVYGTPGISEELAAIAAVRAGEGRLVVRGERLAADLRENSAFLVCMGLGTGAGF
jgi:hypothetical protein